MSNSRPTSSLDLSGTTVLVTGGAGFVGSHLVGELTRRGARTEVADPFRSGSFENLVAEGVAPVVYPVSADHESVLERVEGGVYDAVFHQGAITDTTFHDQADQIAVNVSVSEALFKACCRNERATPLIYASSSAVYGQLVRREPIEESAVPDRAHCSGPLNAYGFSKLVLDETLRVRRAERLVEHKGEEARVPRVVGFRYTNVFGRNEHAKGSMACILHRFIRTAAYIRAGVPEPGVPVKTSKLARSSRGKGGKRDAPAAMIRCFDDTRGAVRDFVPVEAVVATLIDAWQRPVPSGVYNLGSGVETTIEEMLQLCAGFAGRPGEVEEIVEWIPNPHAKRYQYYTCANLAALRAAGLDAPVPEGRAGLVQAAERLFRYHLDRIEADADAAKSVGAKA